MTVLGGGLAGLASAVLAASRGEQVVLYEADRLGGKSARPELQGNQIDLGPSLFAFPAVWQQLAERLQRRGTQVSSPDFLPLGSLGLHLWRGERIWLPVQPGQRYFADWQRYAAATSALGEPLETLLVTPPGPDRRFLQASLALGLGLRALRPAGFLGRLDLPTALEVAIGIHGFNAGVGPEQGSALHAALPGAMLAPGRLAVPQGGVYALVESLRSAASRLGVTVLEGSPVRAVDLHRRRLEVRGGSDPFDLLIAAIDTDRWRQLVGSPLRREALSCSGVSLHGLTPALDLPHQTVLIPDSPQRAGRDLLAGREPHQTLVVIQYWPPGSPAHPHNSSGVLSVLLTAPPNGRHYRGEEPWLRRQLAWAELETGWPLRSWLDLGVLLSPGSLARAGAPGGAIYGRSYPPWRSGPLHPEPWRWPGAPGVVRVGSGLHPGGGVPAVLGGALMLDQRLQKWSPRKRPGRSSPLEAPP